MKGSVNSIVDSFKDSAIALVRTTKSNLNPNSIFRIRTLRQEL